MNNTTLLCDLLGKVNQFGRREYAAMIRAKDVSICGIGSLALYFFYRYHNSNEPFPSLDESKDWFETKVYSHSINILPTI